MRASYCDDISLLEGKLGIAVYFYMLAVTRRNAIYKEYADAYMDDVATGLSEDLPLDFGTGLSGIVWGISFLMHKGSLEAEDGIFADLDGLFERGVENSSLSLYDRLSVAACLVQRLASFPAACIGKKTKMLCNKVFLQLLSDMEAIKKVPSISEFDFFWLFPWSVYLLYRATRLGICEGKLGGLLSDFYKYGTELLQTSDIGGANRLMLHLFWSKLFGEPISDDYIPESVELSSLALKDGYAGLLLCLKIFAAEDRRFDRLKRQLEITIKEAVPFEFFNCFLGVHIMNGKIALAEGLAGVALALEYK